MGAASFREAVVIPVGGAASVCTRQRVEALAASAGDRVVVVLAEDAASWRLMDGETWRYSVVAAASFEGAGAEGWRSFGGRRSGASKPAFVKWLAEARDVDFAWHVEEDAFFTGAWSTLFASSSSSTADVVAARFADHERSGKDWNAEAADGCRVEGRPCGTRGVLRQTFWPVARVSKRLATYLAAGLESRSLSGSRQGSASGAERSHTFERLSLWISPREALQRWPQTLRGFTESSMYSELGVPPRGDHLSSRSLEG